MPVVRSCAAAIMLLCATLSFSQELQEGRLMRFPDVHGERIVFVYGGDLWLASASGGAAHRITTHPGRELFPKFSPDGKWIAFTGQYDGNFNVYVMSSEGGQPRQLTFYQGGAQPLSDRMGIHNEVSHLDARQQAHSLSFAARRLQRLDQAPLHRLDGWRTARASAHGSGRAHFVQRRRHQDRLQPHLPQLPHLEALHRRPGAGHLHLRPQEQRPRAADSAHRLHRYVSPCGTATRSTSPPTAEPSTGFNIYSYDLGSKQIEQTHSLHRLRRDVAQPGRRMPIVFENGGYLYVLDLATRQTTKLTITLPGERELAMKHWTSVSQPDHGSSTLRPTASARS